MSDSFFTGDVHESMFQIVKHHITRPKDAETLMNDKLKCAQHIIRELIEQNCRKSDDWYDTGFIGIHKDAMEFLQITGYLCIFRGGYGRAGSIKFTNLEVIDLQANDVQATQDHKQLSAPEKS